MNDAELLARLNEPVQQLHYEARPDYYKPPALTPELIADFRNRLVDEQNHILIGEVEGEPIGYVVTQVMERGENPYAYATHYLLVDQLSVNPNQQRKHYGEALMQAAFDLAKSLDIQSVRLGVWAFNTGAIAFYGRQGFIIRDIHMETHLE